MSKELAVVDPHQIINVSESALSIDQLLSQRRLITDAMSKAMKEGDHYGKIPGCGDKPTLLQPGAQLLAHLFRLRPEYDVFESDLAHNHKRFRVTCKLFFIGAIPEIKIGEGVGESSSMESKYRFRNAAPEITETGETLPKAFWTWRETEGDVLAKKRLSEAFDGQNVGPKKINGTWQVVIYKGGSDEKVENPNPPDVFNTVLKIAKKRAFVDATITATASSDFFTQDLEDIRDNLAAVEADSKATNGAKTAPGKPIEARQPKGKKRAPEPQQTGGDGDEIPGTGKGKFSGPNHEALFSQLDFAEIGLEDCMASLKFAGLIPENAKSFWYMSDETAKRFVDNGIVDEAVSKWRKESK